MARPELHLVASSAGAGHVPTLDDLITLYRSLTGRDPSPDEIANAKATIARSIEKV